MTARLAFVSILLLAVLSPLRADPAMGHVLSVKGRPTMVVGKNKAIPVTLETPLAAGGKIHTGPDDRLIVEWVPGAFSIIYPNSDLTVGDLDYSKPGGEVKRAVTVSMTKGSIFSHLSHREGISDFRVKTPQGVAAARGTDWMVSFGAGVVKVSVLVDTVTVTLPSGKVISVPPISSYEMGDAASSGMTEQAVRDLLRLLEGAGLSVVLYDPNDPAHPLNFTESRIGYLITFGPDAGDGFSFFIPKWSAGQTIEDILHKPPGETPIPSSQFPPVPHASP